MKSIVETIEKAKSFQAILNILQKNNNLNYLAQVRKSLEKLSKNQQELDILIGTYNKDVSKVFKDKDAQRQIIIQHLLKVAGLLQLYEKNTKKDKNKDKYDFLSDNFEDISDKKLLKFAHKTLLKANKIGGYSIASIHSASPQKISKKVKKAQEINTDFGLTSEMVKQLETAGTEFMMHLIKIDAIISEKVKTIKQIKKINTQSEKIFENTIDKFVNIYEEPNSAFSLQYLKLRKQGSAAEKVGQAEKFQLA